MTDLLSRVGVEEGGERVFRDPSTSGHHRTDGFIFQPDSPYVIGCDSALLKVGLALHTHRRAYANERALLALLHHCTNHPLTPQWKWPELRSVDLEVIERRAPPGYVGLSSYYIGTYPPTIWPVC